MNLSEGCQLLGAGTSEGGKGDSGRGGVMIWRMHCLLLFFTL